MVIDVLVVVVCRWRSSVDDLVKLLACDNARFTASAASQSRPDRAPF